MIEVETYRVAAQRVIGRRIASIDAHDEWYLKRGTTQPSLAVVLIGAQVVGARRIGKLLLLDVAKASQSRGLGTKDSATLGLRFGMTGRLVVDGTCDLGELLYSSHKEDKTFTRFALTFDDGGTLELSDPRRLGGVELDPDLLALGADALAISVKGLGGILADARTSLKARLLDQGRISGIGNLIADEVLWQACLAPNRSAASLSSSEVSALHAVMTATIVELSLRGGSHLGDLMSSRERGSCCPRCGTALCRDTVGGRTTYWCPQEQR